MDRILAPSIAIQGSITPHVLPNVIGVGFVSVLICWLSSYVKARFNIDLSLEVAPYELIGAALGLLLVLRTNSGYERWWEARKLWGGIVNQSRNFVINCLNHGPEDDEWRKQIVNWTITFCHTARHSLRAEKPGAHTKDPFGTCLLHKNKTIYFHLSFHAAICINASVK